MTAVGIPAALVAAGMAGTSRSLRAYTIPDKPRSRMQRYKTMEAGPGASKEPEREP